MKFKVVILSLLLSSSAFAGLAEFEKNKARINKLIEDVQPQVFDWYKHFHAHPELSEKETETAKYLAAEFKKMGLEVHENFGGTGVVAVLKNDRNDVFDAPTIYLRTDMDGLPIEEKTGLEFTSKNKGVMHGCGHDVHMAAMLGYAHVLKNTKDLWNANIVFIGQPAEETGKGAQAMLKAGLYEKFGEPDQVLAFHVSGLIDTGKMKYTSGKAMAALAFFEVDIKGVGGHGGFPEKAVNPIDMGSQLLTRFNELFKDFDSSGKFVYAPGAFIGGTKHNIIPDKAKIMGNLRALSDEDIPKFFEEMQEAIDDMVEKFNDDRGEDVPAVPDHKVNVKDTFAMTYNDPDLMEKLIPVFKNVFGESNVSEAMPTMAAEDFSYYSMNQKYPTAFFFIGGKPANPAEDYGPNHNPHFAPDYKNVLPNAVRTMVGTVFQLSDTL